MDSSKLSALFLLLPTAFLLVVHAPALSSADYTAAVVEHAVISWLLPVINEEVALSIMGRNLDAFDHYTADAASQKADIIVFPEYGITGFVHEERDYVLPFLESVPDPLERRENVYIPCHLKNITHITIQYRLSCMALKHNITIVANLMTVYYCNEESEPGCQPDGRYQYNTDVAFGNGGQLLARYHKENLYTGESLVFDPGHRQTKVAAFKTSFGSFGLFTCFDMLYAEPATRLIAELGVDTMVFPTAWMNELPLLTAVEYQQAWSLSHGVNLLAANIHYPEFQIIGSGIYSPKSGALVYSHEPTSLLGKMLVSKVTNPVSRQRVSKAEVVDLTFKERQDRIPRRDPVGMSGGISSSLLFGISKEPRQNKSNAQGTDKLPLDVAEGQGIHRNIPKYFIAELNDDPYNLTLLEGKRGHAFVSSGKVTCLFDFARNTDNELYALGAFAGLHTMNGNYYIQTCALTRCASDTNPYLCGGEARIASTIFQSFELSMKGQSSRTRLFPEVVTSGVKLPRPNVEWKFSPEMDRIWSLAGALKEPLIAANIFGRLYDLD